MMKDDVSSRRTQRDYSIPEATIPFFCAPRPPLPMEVHFVPGTIWFDTEHGGFYFLLRIDNRKNANWHKVPTFPAWISPRYVWNYMKVIFRQAFLLGPGK